VSLCRARETTGIAMRAFPGALTRPPSLTAEETGRVDAVLLQHDQHPDNLDRAGCAYLATCRWL
jgi:hypothetical protein